MKNKIINKTIRWKKNKKEIKRYKKMNINK